MKEYSAIIQIEFGFSAKSNDDAQKRAEEITDTITGNYHPSKKWMPLEVEATNLDVSSEDD